jgi:hypothetical protein
VNEASWADERQALLGQRISELGLSPQGTRVERLVHQLYQELSDRGISYHPAVYLSDQWGCPDGTPLIGVPFYLVDPRLERIEAEMSGGVEDDREAMRYLRHEAGHAINYAFRLHDREDWRALFGSFSRPYRERYKADPFSRAYVRHILGWYAQKHPDEDFAETFAVWLTPGLDWRRDYDGWAALPKLEYIDRIVTDLAHHSLQPIQPGDDDLPVEAMRYTVGEHYDSMHEALPIGDGRQFDADLRRIFLPEVDAPSSEPARSFLRRHELEIVGRISYWTAEPPSIVRSLVEHLAGRAEQLALRVGQLEAATLIELTAFGTAVVMHFRAGKLSRRRVRTSSLTGIR